jgi:hypothetical protein
VNEKKSIVENEEGGQTMELGNPEKKIGIYQFR